MGGAIDDGGIDRGAFAGLASVEDGREEADDEVERAAADIAHQRGGGDGGRAGERGGPERAREADVVQIMACGMGEGAGLAPAGHAAIGEARVQGVEIFGAEAEFFHDAGAEAFDEAIGSGGELEEGGFIFRVFEIERDGAFAAIEEGFIRHAGRGIAAFAVHDDYIGTEIGEEHSGEGAGAEAFDFDDADPVQHVAPSLGLWGSIGRCVGRGNDGLLFRCVTGRGGRRRI